MKYRVKAIYFLYEMRRKQQEKKKKREREKKNTHTHTHKMKCRKLMIDLVLSGNNLLHFTINANDILFCLIIMYMDGDHRQRGDVTASKLLAANLIRYNLYNFHPQFD